MKKILLSIFVLISMLVSSAEACEEGRNAEAIPIPDNFEGTYLWEETDKNPLVARYASFMYDEEEKHTWGEFALWQAEPEDRGEKRHAKLIRYIGWIGEAKNSGAQLEGTNIFHVDKVTEATYGIDGRIEGHTLPIRNFEYKLTRESEYILKPVTTAGMPPYDIEARYVMDSAKPNLTADTAMYFLEMKAKGIPEIPLKAWKHTYKYYSCNISINDIEDIEATLNKLGLEYCGGEMLQVYDENDAYIGKYFVSSEARNIFVVERSKYKLVWSADADISEDNKESSDR